MAAPAGVVKRAVFFATLLLLAAGGGALWWWAASGDAITVDEAGDSVQSRPRGQLPAFRDKVDVALYRFAAEHPEVLSYMPCTCGCRDLGHTSNRACYIKGETAQRVTFTSHAAT